MLFAKRNLKSGFFGLLAKPAADNEEAALRPVAHEERRALLGQPTRQEAEDSPSMRNQTVQVRGPVEHLMGSIEQFNRHVIEARRKGTGFTRWTDAVMNELIRGVEIAIGEGWMDMMEALTDAGRILQSYEDAGQPESALPFLAESHEILALMGADLMIGPVRSGVMRKWRNHYQRAVASLEDLGIPLAKDDEDGATVTAAPPKRPVVDDVDQFGPDFPFSGPALTPLRTVTAEDPLPTLDELMPLGEPIDTAEPVAEPAELADATIPGGAPDFDISRITPFPNKTEEPRTDRKPARKARNEGTDGLQGSFFEDLFASPAADEPAAPEVIHLPQERPATSPEVVSTLDALCEALALLEKGGEAAGTAFASVLSYVERLHVLATEQERRAAAELCTVLIGLCERAEGQAGPLEKFFELGYAFCGAYVDATGSTDDPAMTGWVEECETLLRTWDDQAAIAAATEYASADPIEVTPPAHDSDAAPEPAQNIEEILIETEPEATAVDEEQTELEPETDREPLLEAAASRDEVVEPVDEPAHEIPNHESAPSAPDSAPVPDHEIDDSSPEHLLEIAAQAIGRGEIKNAKMLALHAAASIARLEAAQAETQLHEAELRLQKGAEAIQRARTAVQQAETDVLDAESRVSEGMADLNAQRNVTIEAAEKVEAIEQRLHDLDEQIQKLMARRAEEADQLKTMQGVYTQAQSREGEAEDALRMLKETEQNLRVKLENARQQVKTLERRRSDVEAAMEKARELLLEKRAAHHDIEQTLSQVRLGKPASAGAPEDLLF